MVAMLRSAASGYDASGGQRRFGDAFGDQSNISGWNLPCSGSKSIAIAQFNQRVCWVSLSKMRFIANYVHW